MLTRKVLVMVTLVSIIALFVAGCGSATAAPKPLATEAASAPRGGGGGVAQAVASPVESMARVVNVTGSGTSSAKPDVVYVEFGVEAIQTDPQQAVNDSTTRMSAIMEVLKELKIEDKNIQTVNYSMYLEQMHDKDGNPTGESRYHVINQVRVKLTDLSQVGTLLTDVLKAGANNVGGISFSIADPEALAKQARDKAIADARAKAEQLASGFGAKLGGIHQISEYGGSTVPQAAAMTKDAFGMGGGGAVPVSGGELSVSVQVQVAFDLE